MHRNITFMVLLVFLMGLIAACEEDDSSDDAPPPQTPAEIAEVMLEAINNNDVDTAASYLCEKDIELLQANPPSDIYPQFSRVNCAGNESIVTCTYTIEIEGTSTESGLEAVFDVIDDGNKLCSAETN